MGVSSCIELAECSYVMEPKNSQQIGESNPAFPKKGGTPAANQGKGPRGWGPRRMMQPQAEKPNANQKGARRGSQDRVPGSAGAAVGSKAPHAPGGPYAAKVCIHCIL